MSIVKSRFVSSGAGILAASVMGLMWVGTAQAQSLTLEALLEGLNTSTEETMSASPEMDTDASLVVSVNLTDAEGIGEAVGTVTLEDTEYGLLLQPNLTGLVPGIHGFHIHQNPACGPGEKDGSAVPGLAAGGHYDPTETGTHAGPYANGHLGDLPPLFVDESGSAMTPVLAPRLVATDVVGRSLMIHMMGDNFSDDPAPLGGGGARLACGVI